MMEYRNNGWKLLDIAEKWLECVQMDENGWKWMEVADNGWKWMKMAVNG